MMSDDPMDAFKASVQRTRMSIGRLSTDDSDKNATDVTVIPDSAQTHHDTEREEAAPSLLYGTPATLSLGERDADTIAEDEPAHEEEQAEVAMRGRGDSGDLDEDDEELAVERTRQELLRQLAALPAKAPKKGKEKEVPAKNEDAEARERLSKLVKKVKQSQEDVQGATRVVAEARATLEKLKVTLEGALEQHRGNKEALDAMLQSAE
ncbi:hypothetical protein PG984_011220 [Apiospora sp. TS-2023a]